MKMKCGCDPENNIYCSTHLVPDWNDPKYSAPIQEGAKKLIEALEREFAAPEDKLPK